MKTIKIISLLLLFFCFTHAKAQLWTVINTPGTVIRGDINDALANERVLIAEQRRALRKLKRVEKDYDNRRQASANFASSVMMTAISTSVVSTNDLIQKLEEKIDGMKRKSLLFKYGLKRYEPNLDTEKRYLEEIRSEYNTLIAAILWSGGPGYNYASFLKIYIRTLEIRRNVLSIDYQVNNLITVNETLK